MCKDVIFGTGGCTCSVRTLVYLSCASHSIQSMWSPSSLHTFDRSWTPAVERNVDVGVWADVHAFALLVSKSAVADRGSHSDITNLLQQAWVSHCVSARVCVWPLFLFVGGSRQRLSGFTDTSWSDHGSAFRLKQAEPEECSESVSVQLTRAV